jgi:hypothetical protein
MRFLPSAEREPYFEPGLRSAGANTLRFCVPTIVSIDPKSRHVSRHELYAPRRDIDSRLPENLNQLKTAPYSEAGQLFFRRIDVHTGDLLTTKQEISITLLIHEEKHPVNNLRRASEVPRAQSSRSFTVLIWTNSNGDGTTAKVPSPGTPSFLGGNLVSSFCPMILDRSHVAALIQAPGKVDMRNRKQSQTPSFLPSHHEHEFHRCKVTASARPFTATHGLFQFAACAVPQFLEVLSVVIDCSFWNNSATLQLRVRISGCNDVPS